jgi:ribosomal protein L35
MPKIKTNKSVVKRFHFSSPKTGKGRVKKVLQRRAGQDHFNARESTVITKRKRRDKEISKSFHKTIKTLSGVKK